MSSYKVLVLGANGMLGKMVSLYLSTNKNFNVEVTTRNKTEFILENFKNNSHILDINQNSLLDIVNNDKFNFIINCIGVIKPKINENDNVSVKETILTNSYFPLSIQNIAKDENIKYIQIGTDCVFSGLAGDHFEDSYKDAEDLYGK